MAIHSTRGRKRPSQQTTQVEKIPAASAGMDGRVGLAAGNMDVAVYTYNLMSSEYGMKVRSGYREQAVDLLTATSTGVKTIIPFEAVGDASADRLFVATNEGIWDVTTYDTPILVQAFTIFDGNSGIGVFTHYITDAGANLLFYADGENGLFQYDQDTDLWTVPAGITGVDVTLIRFVVVHKQRIWFIQQDSTDGWYLPISSISGLAVKFQFGAQFKHGGKLAGLYNWTVDGGLGLDDYLVAISGAGDILPYQGSDPEATGADAWNVRGVYYVGAVAGSKRCASEFGGDLYILSTYGLTAMSDLLNGVDASDTTGKQGIGARMARLLEQDMKEYRIDDGWGVGFTPSAGNLVISSPKRKDDVYLQYVYDLANNSFGWWRGVPMISFAEWQGKIYLGTEDSRVLVMDNDRDDVRITPVNEDNGFLIEFSTLFAFSAYDSSGRYKRGVAIRPDFLSSRQIGYEVKFAYDYDILAFSNIISGNSTAEGRWDNGVWDLAIWGSTERENRATVVGGTGIGRNLAVAVNGSGDSDTWLISYDAMWNSGGIL